MKKTILSLIFAFILSFSVLLTGCKDKGLPNNPPTQAEVFSNGGMSVVKGDYLYFVNGYVDETTLTKDDNKAGKVKKGALYRTKLSDREIDKNKDGFLNNADLVVSKVVGFSNGGFEIIDDHIYYATPYMKLDKAGVLQSNRVEIHRIDIDGTDDKVIYTTSTAETELDWTMRKVGDKAYLLIYEGGKIRSVNASNGDVVGTVENSTSYAFLKETEYRYNDDRTSFLNTHVVYTRSIEGSDGVFNYNGNAISAMDIATGEISNITISKDNTYTIKHVNEYSMYYTYTSTAVPTACLYKKAMIQGWNQDEETKLTNMAYDSYYFVDHGNDLIIATTGDFTWRLEGDVNTAPRQILSASRDIIAVSGNYGYYLSDSKLIRFDINGLDVLQDAFGDLSTLITNENFIDFDERRVYVYAEYTASNGDKNHYLSYFADNFANDEFKLRFVGVFEDGDVPAKPEQPEPEYEGDEVEYVPHVN